MLAQRPVDREDPWTRLGALVRGMPAPQALSAAGADFEVKLYPAYALDPDTGEMAPIPGTFSTGYRDAKTGLLALASTGERYTITQNRELLERAFDIAKASGGDAIVSRCGTLDERRRFFTHIELGNLVIDPAGVGDRMARGLCVYSSHDGKLQIVHAMTDVRVATRSTVLLQMAPGLERVYKTKHTPNGDHRATDTGLVMSMSREWARAFKSEGERLLGTSLTPAQVDRALMVAFPLSKGATARQQENSAELGAILRHVYEDSHHAVRLGHNAWALLLAVCTYLDHHRPALPVERALTTFDDASWVSTAKLTLHRHLTGLW